MDRILYGEKYGDVESNAMNIDDHDNVIDEDVIEEELATGLRTSLG